MSSIDETSEDPALAGRPAMKIGTSIGRSLPDRASARAPPLSAANRTRVLLACFTIILKPKDHQMKALSHLKLIALITSLAFQIGCINDDFDDDFEQTSSTSTDLSQLYEIRSVMNNKCLDVLAFNNDNGAEAGMWDCWGGSNQRWYWNGSEIRSLMNNKCLDVLAFNNDNGAHVGMWDCWGGANQQWYPDWGQIRSRFNNKCLDLLAFNNDNGARVGMWDCWGGSNQQWYMRPV